jgi:hypothetical protein
MSMAITKVTCSLDLSSYINGHLAKDPRFVSVDNKNIEIDLSQLTNEEKASQVIKNVTIEEFDADWVTNMNAAMGCNWSSSEVSDAWKTTKKTIIDIDYSETATKLSGQVYDRILNVRVIHSNLRSSEANDGIKV